MHSFPDFFQWNHIRLARVALYGPTFRLPKGNMRERSHRHRLISLLAHRGDVSNPLYDLAKRSLSCRITSGRLIYSEVSTSKR